MSRRLLFVVNHAGFFLSHRLPIALAAKEQGWDVHVATPPSKHSPLIARQFPWHPIAMSRSGRNPLSEAQCLISLIKLYRSLRPDLVHHVTTKPVLYGTIAARLTRVPAVVNALAGLGHLFVEGRGPAALFKHLLGSGYRLALGHPNMRVIFQNEEDRAIFVSNHWIRAEESVMIPGSGVDQAVFHPPVEENSGPLMVVLASRMLETKGVAEFVEAAERLRASGSNARFVLVGEPDPDNPASVSLEQLREWNDRGVVEYWGRRDDMPEIFRRSALVVLPTYYREGVPKVLIEAAASAVPIVTTDMPGCRDVVIDGVNGRLIPPRDVDALAATMAELLADPALRRRMGNSGREHMVAHFSLSRVIESTLAVYGELLHA